MKLILFFLSAFGFGTRFRAFDLQTALFYEVHSSQFSRDWSPANSELVYVRSFPLSGKNCFDFII